MKREDIFREFGLIDENLIKAAENSGVKVRKKGISKMWIALVSCLVLYCSTSTVLLAMAYYEKHDAEPYLRYLTAENMELQPVTHYDANKFLQALKSDNNEHVYVAINRLVETFNDERLREKALHELHPFLESDNQKIADASAFAIDILSKGYKGTTILQLADGSKIFTLFNNYSDYGSQNVIWRIKDDVLEEYYHFPAPSLYIRKMIPSPDQKSIAVVTVSNKSEFIQIINVEEGINSPELVESARIKYGAQKELETWIRTDHENYSYVNNIAWKDDNTLQFEASLAYENTEIIENVTVTYQFSNKVMEVKELNESR
ncbi:hypothetical protein [Sporosarcina limicola]|uniref:Uncharacterized protein n=1 Tax=Sporosarcina limicola TaxID=34101 RepID=A0A927MG15_9BACL|nr:hypothetical protein [Sporosarcina limicola]MBE1553198.1 hypothetical protein [Sporosarcina limicola]